LEILRAVAHQGGAWLLEKNVQRGTWLDRSAKREVAQVKILRAAKTGLPELESRGTIR